ncbi:hypothetical protein PVAG01_08773 [Phlyctema vagabunda]|uniref:2EXR domain-containing protein n=1 Tax=Phlyctema vagabunda TaxID=108571 RepID=A0ABR4PAC8_9HELO
MSPSIPVVSLGGGNSFTFFTHLPVEIRFFIWRLSLVPRIVEIIASNDCSVGFYSQATLPATLQACRESRKAVEFLYPRCFGSFLQPERIRFNFQIDILYVDVSQEEEGLYRLFAMFKEAELRSLEHFALDEGFLLDELTNFQSKVAVLKTALKAMTNLKNLVIVSDVSSEDQDDMQMKFYPDSKTGEAEEGWPDDVVSLDDVQEKYASWNAVSGVKMTAVYGWRTPRL